MKTKVILLIAVFVILAIFLVSPIYRCPVDGGIYILGVNATLVTQLNGTKTLCHETDGAKDNTLCHNFTGGIHGFFSKVK